MLQSEILIVEDDRDLAEIAIDYMEEKGFQFIEKLRNETELPVIFISARTSDTDKVKGLMLGGDDYLSKYSWKC